METQQAKLFYDGSSSRGSSRGLEEETVVGFDDEAMKLVEQLNGIREQLEVISIVGMAGLGKTTLARKVYNHPYIVYHFHVRAWTCVSQLYRRRDLLLGIISSVTVLTDEIYKMSDENLSDFLRKLLMPHRYLIVMDDMWGIGAWDDLKRSFPDKKTGSRIMFTSRFADVALHSIPDSLSHSLRFLTQDESWVLLNLKVFRKESCPPELKEVGNQIIEKCQGLPLALVVVAGILANKMTPYQWRQVAEGVNSYIVSDPNQYMETLELSYNHLPRHLQKCFLYLGAFPEDHEILVRKLIWLWVAEGFIHQIGRKSLEDVAEDYLMDLINRNLVMVDKKRSSGGTKTCRIHDLLRDLCLKKAKDENFLQNLYWWKRNSFHFSYTNKSHRLCIHYDVFLHIPSLPSTPHISSLLCLGVKSNQYLPHSMFNYQALKLLRVLDLSSVRVPFFPTEIVELVYLRFFALQAENGSLPISIYKLRYLETLVVSSRRNIVVLQDIWKMTSLRHLYIKSGINYIEETLLEGALTSGDYPILENIQTISLVCPSLSCQDVLARTPNLRKLGFRGPLLSESRALTFPELGFVNRLETLKLLNTTINEVASSCNPIKFPETLVRLTLSNTALEWNEMWTIGMLPNLEVLKLKHYACIGQQWETSEGGFHRLQFLKFEDLDIVQWNASDDHFPRLQHLVLHVCGKLEEIPSGLGDISTLEMIEVSWTCSSSAANSARMIQKEQQEKGNDWLKIKVSDNTWELNKGVRTEEFPEIRRRKIQEWRKSRQQSNETE